MNDKSTPKHPAYNCQRGMLCPACDKALWVRVEIQGLLGKKKITIKEQPNFCKFCGQALLPAYTERGHGMSKYIDAEIALKTIDNYAKTVSADGKVIVNAIRDIVGVISPTADVVDVVYCRECKHNEDNGGDCNRTITHRSRDYVCEVNIYKYIGLEYCSYGERREE